MTVEEKIEKLEDMCSHHGGCVGCKHDVRDVTSCAFDGMSEGRVNELFAIAFPNMGQEQPHIKDSGNRREFETGAVRDMQEGKGRCDLLPLDVVSEVLGNGTLCFIHAFQQTGDYNNLIKTLISCGIFCDQPDTDPCGMHTIILEVAKHFEEGCKKYGENNWRKGIPAHCYIDSAVRHYLKWLRGDKDEPHDRAFCWNILCCIWTCINKPELNDYAKEQKDQHG